MIKTFDVTVTNKYTPSYKNLNFKYNSKEMVHADTMNMFDYYSDIKKKAFYMLDYLYLVLFHILHIVLLLVSIIFHLSLVIYLIKQV